MYTHSNFKKHINLKFDYIILKFHFFTFLYYLLKCLTKIIHQRYTYQNISFMFS